MIEHDEIGKVALLNPNLAEVRGRGSAVVEMMNLEKPYFSLVGGAASRSCEADSILQRYDDNYFPDKINPLIRSFHC